MKKKNNFTSLKSLKKGVGSGVGSGPDPDPLARGTDLGSGSTSAPTFHGYPALVAGHQGLRIRSIFDPIRILILHGLPQMAGMNRNRIPDDIYLKQNTYGTPSTNKYRICVNGGSLYRSNGHHINAPQINCSIQTKTKKNLCSVSICTEFTPG
jgi:hypothetical protein